MSFNSSEQAVHDRINLARLVRRLEKTVATESWLNERQPSQETWLLAQGTLQKVKYARRLVKNVEVTGDLNSDDAIRLQELRRSIEHLESVLLDVATRVAPEPKRPPPILPLLPLPVDIIEDSTSLPLAPDEPLPSDLLPVEASTTQDLLLSPSDSDTLSRPAPIDPNATLFPPVLPIPAAASSQKTPAFLQNSAALQEEMSAQLAQMATQLKRNAIHFSNSLEKDKALVQETQEKLERNHDVMSKERVRLRDHHSKSWGTTWITMLSLVVVIIGFLLSFFVIRFT